MVWPFTSWSNGSAQEQPSQSLDRSLADFVSKQSPAKYEPAAPSKPHAQPTSSPSQSSRPQDGTAPPVSNTDAPIRRTNKSLFSDGRYDHLWATYRSQAEVESEARSENEKMHDLLVSFKDRQNQVRRAAMENCSTETAAQLDCLSNGSWTEKASMCRQHTRRIDRCFDAQMRLLRALGYMAEHARPAEQEDDIQVHADDLYRRMLEQERLVEEAAAQGREPPVFAPLKPHESIAAGSSPWAKTWSDSQAAADDKGQDKPDDPWLPPEAQNLKPKLQTLFKDRLRKMTPAERELERRAISLEIKSAQKTGSIYEEMLLEQMKDRQARRDAGKATLGDRLQGLFGW